MKDNILYYDMFTKLEAVSTSAILSCSFVHRNHLDKDANIMNITEFLSTLCSERGVGNPLPMACKMKWQIST